MKKIFVIIVALSCCVLGAAPFKDGDRVVFFGDSITHGGFYGEYVNLFYATRYPERNIWFSNSGWSGAAAEQGLWSVEDDIVAKKPTVVTVMFGMNDIRYHLWPRTGDTAELASKREEAMRTYDERMDELVRRVRSEAGNPEIIYFTPSPYDQTCLVDGKPSDLVCNDGLAILAEHVRGWAKRDDAVCVDLQRTMLEANSAYQAVDPSASVISIADRVHPGPLGHTIMLYEILKAQGAEGVVDEIERDAGGADSMAFSCKEKSLPFPLTDKMRDALCLVPFENDFNREILRIKNLKEGRYAVKIDGAEVGTWTATELAEGVNLALNDKTPQYRQAEKAAEICRRLWDGERKIRDFVTSRRFVKRHYKMDPDAPGTFENLIQRLVDEGKGNSYGVRKYREYLRDWSRHSEIEEGVVKDRAALAEAVRPIERRFEITAFETSEAAKLDRSVMSEKYWELWNDDVQQRIDADIEKYRKADATFEIAAPDGSEVKVEQIGHAFFFGAHIFNFNQLGKKEWNDRYKELYGTLFNSATVAFYWKTLEPYPGQVRFQEGARDVEEFWNTCADPMHEPHWRRPPPDPVVSFLKIRGCRIHGHPLCWGDIGWHSPTWLWDDFCPQTEKEALEEASGVKIPSHDWRKPMGLKEHMRDEDRGNGVESWPGAWACVFERLSEEEVAKLCPTFFENMNRLTYERVRQIAARYGSRIDSWDVCNETSPDFSGKSATGKPFQKSKRYGIMAGDLCYNAFKAADACLPKTAWLNINDYSMDERYVAQIEDLQANGCRIDVVGSQMHLFNPRRSEEIAAGEGPAHLTPDGLDARFKLLSKPDKPIHLSEITITAPDATMRGQMIQANIVRNLYRKWFSIEKMNGITWWNVVDDCGAPGEPNTSGIFTRDMRPKAAYFVMNDLINREWKTKTTVKSANGKVAFRGFRGRYRLTWKDADGKEVSKLVTVK